MSRIIETSNLFSIDFETGGQEVLCKQTYTDSEPFYWIQQIDERHFVRESVDGGATESELKNILGWYSRRISSNEKIVLSENQVEIITIYKYYIRKYKEMFTFLESLIFKLEHSKAA